MAEPTIDYIQCFPSDGTLERALGVVIKNSPDAIVLGAYDSGKVPDCLAATIRTATSQQIAVFGIRQTVLDTHDIDLGKGAEAFDNEYELQPDMLRAGLVPLQVYPPGLVALSADMNRLQNSIPGFPLHTAARIDEELMAPYLLNGLHDICSQYTASTDRIREARQRFSSPGFNKRIDDVLNAPN